MALGLSSELNAGSPRNKHVPRQYRVQIHSFTSRHDRCLDQGKQLSCLVVLTFDAQHFMSDTFIKKPFA